MCFGINKGGEGCVNGLMEVWEMERIIWDEEGRDRSLEK